MSFTSFLFWIFLTLVFLAYFLFPKKSQWVILLAASYIFYLFSGFGMVVFLLFTTTITFFTGLQIDRVNNRLRERLDGTDSQLSIDERDNLKISARSRKKFLLTTAILVVFGLLGLLKYFNFFTRNANALSQLLAINVTLPILDILLPLGISFFTFQSVAYVVDIHRGKIRAERDFAKFALFLSFFPQIVQGPISRFDQLAQQLFEPHSFKYENFKFGMQLVFWGLFKKLVIADRLKIAVDSIFDQGSGFEGLSVVVGILFFSFQMYCDFSGGIDIARGIAEAMGIHLVENFKRPFFSRSIDEYWRRWHITLGSWMRDYVFYPLSLSKAFTRIGRVSRKLFGRYLGKIFPTMIATVITFLAVGLWHGPYWKYVAFGLYYGILISLGMLIAPLTQKMSQRWKINAKRFPGPLLSMLFVFTMTTIARYFVRADGFRHALFLLQKTISIFNPQIFFDGTLLQLGLIPGDYVILAVAVSILLIVEILQEKGIHLRSKIADQKLILRWSFYLIGIFAVLIFGVYGPEYNTAEFIYRGF